MRVDKYLWATRYFKTRNQATTACKKGHIHINGQAAKPSREIYPTDKLRIRKDQTYYELTVLDIPPSRVSAKLVDIYRKDTTSAEALEHQQLSKLTRELYRKKGTGRPTKKDRREIEGYLENPEENTEVEKGSPE